MIFKYLAYLLLVFMLSWLGLAFYDMCAMMIVDHRMQRPTNTAGHEKLMLLQLQIIAILVGALHIGRALRAHPR